MKKSLLIVSVILVLAFALTSCGAVTGLQTATDAGNAFMQALKDNNNAASWSMLADNVKEELGSEAAWADFTLPRNFSAWTFTSTNIENNVAQLDGEATLGADTYLLTLILDANGDGWLVSGINITLK